MRTPSPIALATRPRPVRAVVRTGASVPVRLLALVRRLLMSEPTLYVEVGSFYSALVWAICLAAPRATFELSPQAFSGMARWGELFWALAAGVVAVVQLVAILVDAGASSPGPPGATPARARAAASVAAAVFWGFLAGSVLVPAPLAPMGWVYAGGALACLIPLWRVYLD